MEATARIYDFPIDFALIHSKPNLGRQRPARLSFQWVVVCQPADTEGFLWAANMKVFLRCWLCYFQLKDGGRHSVYVFTCQAHLFHLFSLRSGGGGLFGWQAVNKVYCELCGQNDLLKNWLLQVFFFCWFMHFSCGKQLTAPASFESLNQSILWFLM